MNFSIETIESKDFPAVRGIIADSYKNDEPNTDGDEVDMIDRLRSYDQYNSDFEVVAKDHDHKVLGHSLMVPVRLRSQKRSLKIASIVEISVLQDYQNQGIGHALVKELETRAQLAGYPTVAAIDNTDFFYENNYVASENFNIYSTLPVDLGANLIKPLFDGSLFNRSGKIYYPEEFFGVRSSRV